MKNRLSIVSAALSALFSAGCICGTPAESDPELFKTKSTNMKRYAGVMPERVRTIAFISPGSTPHELHRKGIELIRNAGYNVKVMPHASTSRRWMENLPTFMPLGTIRRWI